LKRTRCSRVSVIEHISPTAWRPHVLHALEFVFGDLYVTLFNANDPRFIKFYHDDVVFELNSATVIKGATAIRDFYTPVKAHIHEKVEVAAFVADATGIAAELPTEFRCYKDWENGFFQRPLKAGEVMRTISFGFYEVKDGKFKRIRATRYKQIHDWRMEP